MDLEALQLQLTRRKKTRINSELDQRGCLCFDCFK